MKTKTPFTVFGCVLAGATGLLVACSEEDSGPPEVSSFHYVETVTGNIEGDPIDSREEGYYRAPDAARIVGDAEYSPLGQENIVIGSQVWERRGSNWTASTTEVACYNALDKINVILRYGGQHEESTQTQDGPTKSEEPTHLHRWEYEDAGRTLINASEVTLGDSESAKEVLAATKEVFSDLSGTTELVVGKETGRVYSLIQTLDGPKISRSAEIVVDQYDQPVEIAPPPNVPAAADEGSAGCPEFGDDFPWIPATVAAILIPLVFLGASAFLWPRRPSAV
jgi:hypothetical protein